MCLFPSNLFRALWAGLSGEENEAANKPQGKKKKPLKQRAPQHATCQPASLGATCQVKANGLVLGRWFEEAPESGLDQEDSSEQSGGARTHSSSEQFEGDGGANARRELHHQQHHDELVPLVGVRDWESERRQYYASNLLNNFSGPQEFLGEKSSAKTSTTKTIQQQQQQQQKQQQKQHNQDKTNSAQEFSSNRSSGGGAKLLLGLVSDNEHEKTVIMSGQQPFRIRTSGRRHLDFDESFELDDASAPQRSHWSAPFHFIQAADCQFGMIDSYVHHRTEPGWSEEIELCERLVDVCNRQQPRPLFMIICGDLVDSLPKSEIGRKQVVDFKRIFARLDPAIPLVCVCGNHDVGDEPTPQTVADYRETFGDDYFYFTKNDILFIVINSQFYQNRDHVGQEALEQDQWLERVLSKCRLFKYSIVFEHIPWFLEQPDEDNDYFNIRKEVRLTWLRKFKEAGVTKIMCGHYHRNAGGWFEGMELVVTSAIGAQCGNDKSGVRIVKVFEDTIEHQYYAMADIPLNVELKRTLATNAINNTSGGDGGGNSVAPKSANQPANAATVANTNGNSAQ